MKISLSKSTLLFVILIDSAGLGIVYPIFAYYFLEPSSMIFNIHVNEERRLLYLGILFALYPFFMAIGSFPLGKLSDQWGRKKILLGCLMGFCLGFILLAVGMSIHALWLIMLGRIAAGLTAGCDLIAQASMADISENNIEKAKNIGAVVVAGSLGFVLGPLLGGLLSDSDITPLFTIYTPFIVIVFFGFIAIGLLYFFFEETLDVKKQTPVENMLFDLKLLKNHHILYLSLIFFLFILGWNLFFQFTPVYLETYFHVSSNTAGFFMSFVAFIFMASVAIKPLLKSLGLKISVLIGLLLLAISIFIALNLSMFHWFWIVIIPFCVGGGFAYIASLGLFSNAVSAEQQGHIMGVANALRSLAWTLAPIASGIITSIYIKLPMVSAGICFIIALLLAIFLKLDQKYKNSQENKL